MIYEQFTIIVDGIYTKKQIENRGVKVLSPYRYKNFFARCLRKIGAKLHIKEPFLYNKEIHKIDTNNIIIFDALITKEFLQWVLKLHKDKRIIFYYYNPVVKSFNIKDIPNDIECWSYSEKDSEDFNIKYNHQFYVNDIVLKKTAEKFDVYFCGLDKGRMRALLNLETIFKEQGLKCKIKIMPTRWYQRWFNKRYEKNISYEQILSDISTSKAILDYNNDIQSGYTLRVMEAIFFRKKLISNNINLKRSIFYNPDNIFIIGKDKFEELVNFINKPFHDIKDIDEYDLKNWLIRFLE